MHDELEPMAPEQAVELYLEDKRSEYAELTLASHESRLRRFLRWCEEECIDNLNKLTGRKLKAYKIWRRNDSDLAPASLKGQLATLRVFLRWCENIEAVPQDIHIRVQLPTLSKEEDARDVALHSDDAEAMLTYLGKCHYASLEHVTLALLWHTMLRRGSARALDVDDYYRNE